ncbi:phosphotriesterase family protein [Fodinicurvata sediminis]|uniref:phosphotriesterase family protein n=1 Tax=Fodinicurvata sediminis TaxID=1121832 RepID=UPI0003B738C4|nr:aryldialkylphosphatase [Fodinicurvata sediminis]
MNREDLKGKIQTVTGLIEPEALGQTLMHEHVLCDIRSPAKREIEANDPEITLQNYHDIAYGRVEHITKYRLDMIEVAKEEMRQLNKVGGQAVVELTCGGLRPDPEGLVEVAKDSDVDIIMGCGHYVEEYQDPENFNRSVDDFAQEMVGQVFGGAWGTEIRAGLIGEIGCQSPWTDLEKTVMRGALIAQEETGAALNVHPGRDQDQPQEVADFVKEHGGDVSRLVISHIDRTIFDEERLLRLADTGCIIEFDLFGLEHTYYPLADIDMPNDGARLKFIRTLIEHGHMDQIVISQDICYRTRLSQFGGHGYAHIFKNVLPLMRERNFTENEIEAILVRTPRRILTIQ